MVKSNQFCRLIGVFLVVGDILREGIIKPDYNSQWMMHFYLLDCGGEIAQLVKALGRYESRSLLYHLYVPQSISLLCITYSVIKGNSYHTMPI